MPAVRTWICQAEPEDSFVDVWVELDDLRLLCIESDGTWSIEVDPVTVAFVLRDLEGEATASGRWRLL